MSAEDGQLSVPVVQKQIDTLREQLFRLNEHRNNIVASAAKGQPLKRGGKLSDLTTEEHQLLARNEALRAEKAKLEKEMAKDPPEVLDKKNALREVERSVDTLTRELEKLVQVRDAKREEAAVIQARNAELQQLQSTIMSETSDNRQLHRDLQKRIKDAEKKLLASHERVVKLNERSKHGVPAAEAQRLTEEVASQEKQIEQLEADVKRARYLEQKTMMRGKALRGNQPTDAEKEVTALQDQIKKLEEVLVSRDAELKKSYDYAARVKRGGGHAVPSSSKAASAVTDEAA